MFCSPSDEDQPRNTDFRAQQGLGGPMAKASAKKANEAQIGSNSHVEELKLNLANYLIQFEE